MMGNDSLIGKRVLRGVPRDSPQLSPFELIELPECHLAHHEQLKFREITKIVITIDIEVEAIALHVKTGLRSR